MIRNYFKIAFRNLWKNRGYSFLNIAGLAIGITCSALIFLNIEDELTWNDNFKNKAQLYQVKDSQQYDGVTYTFDATPGPLARGIKEEIPGIKHTARSSWQSRNLFNTDDKNLYQTGQYVDSSFLHMFQLEFIHGKPQAALKDKRSIVISGSMAQRLFNSVDVLGKSINMNQMEEFVITGIFQDLPENSSLRFDWLASFDILESQNPWMQSWTSNSMLTYVEVEENADVDGINTKLYDIIDRKSPGAIAKMSIYPMERWRLYNNFDNGVEVEGSIKYVRLFGIIAVIILLIACINFMNLATARSEQRSREVGVRKVLGADKKNLIAQFLGESIILSFLSALVAVGLIFLSLPAFNTLVEKNLSLDLFQPLHLLSFAGIALFCGIIAGSYPSFHLSSFNPIKTLKGTKAKTGIGAGLVRKSLVTVQFVVSVTFIISTIIIYQQIQHVKSRDVGYDKNGLVYLNLQGEMENRFEAIRNDLVQTGIVENASISSNMPLQLGSNTGDFYWKGKDPDKTILTTVEDVSPEYFETIGLDIVKGRGFNSSGTNQGDVVINETLAEMIGNENIIGSNISRSETRQYKVVGVVKDFLYNNMYSTPAPLIFFNDTSNFYYATLAMRLTKNADLNTALPTIEEVMRNNNPGYPVEFKFIDEAFGNYFQNEVQIGRLSGIFATLAIVISCLGLFGLTAFTAERRTREIGIRKVLGASVSGLASLLSKEFLKLVVLSCLISFPLAWWFMHHWLLDYSYRIEISWWIFALAGIIALAIAVLTVSVQVLKAAFSNPVKSLRTE